MTIADENRATFDHFRALLASGAITYEQAKAQAGPTLDAMNAKGAEIAKRHGKKFRPFTFSKIIR